MLRKAKLNDVAASLVTVESIPPCTASVQKMQESEAAQVSEGEGSHEVCQTPLSDVMARPCGWTSPTTSTDHPWSAPHSSDLQALKLAPPLSAHGMVVCDTKPATTRSRMAVTVEVPVSPSENFWSQHQDHDEISAPSSPASVVSVGEPALRLSRGGDELEQSSLLSSKPLFKYRGLFYAPEDEQPVVQLDQPLFRSVPTERDERYDSDVDSIVDSATGSETPTSVSSSTSAAASTVSDLDFETLVRSMLGGQGLGLVAMPPATRGAKAAKDKDIKDFRWELADRWATSGLQSFPAPWSIY